MSREQDEGRVHRVAAAALQRWLATARDMVMAPWRRHQVMPDPAAIFATQQLWNNEVDTILTVLGEIAMGAWSEATDVPPGWVLSHSQ